MTVKITDEMNRLNEEWQDKYSESIKLMKTMIGQKIIKVTLAEQCFSPYFVIHFENGEHVYFYEDVLENEIFLSTDVQYDHIYYKVEE